MMILADIGEIGIICEDGREVILRPSLYSMSKLGDKNKIVDIFHEVMGGNLAYSLAVMQVCCDEDIRDITGYIDTADGLSFIEGMISIGEVIILAQSLLKHGIIGDVERATKSVSKKDYTQVFDAKSYVSAVIAHLGISEREAWGMTMTSIAGALQSKFPPQKSDKMTIEEADEIEEWFNNRHKGK